MYICVAVLCVSVWACVTAETEETAEVERAGTVTQGSNMQGSNMQGSNMQGSNMQGMSLEGFRLDSAMLGGAALSHLRVEKGELIAEQDGATRRGASLIGAGLQAQVKDLTVSPAASSTVEYRITNVEAELAAYDPTHTGATYLYTLERWDAATAAWQPACAPDTDGRRVAIPLSGWWDGRGNRIESTTLFTLGCTAGVIAKCYRWGYRPWLTGYGTDMKDMHQTCTRLARADYCGDGVSHTRDGTLINVWDNLPAPGPVQRHGLLPPLGMIFEGGWGPDGAICLSHARWLVSLGGLFTNVCPNGRLIPPGLGGLACNSLLDVLFIDPSVRMFNESYLNIDLGGILGL